MACGGGGDKTGDPDGGMNTGPLGDIGDELRAIPGMTVEEQTTMLEGYRFFVLTYDQPVDHQDPNGAHFAQRMTLLHRDYGAPVVVHNSGYYVSTRGNRAGVTVLIDGNQLSMEHRFFLPSRPDPADWSKLSIEQAADDQHRIIQALKARIYHDNKFLTTGASKGGMTSLFHRRFFPDDVDATLALVAPIDYPDDAVQSPTNRYIKFLESVGTDATCRQKLKDFQNLALARRTAMKTRMQQAAAFTLLGLDRALEFAVEEAPFIFWQYGSQSNCTSIPAATATDDQVFQFLDDTVSVASYGDDDLAAFLPYYHQSATQLGYPISDESYLVDLMFPNGDTAQAYVPSDIPTPAYDNGAAMHEVQDFISTSGTRIMLIYGQNDPWSAGQVDLGAATDSFKYISPAGNHGSSIGTLAQPEQDEASAAVMRWLGVTAKPAKPHPGEVTLEQEELAQRHHRL